MQTVEMVYIPGGTFVMGSPWGKGCDNERPQHEVTVTEFFMGRHLVTQKQWKEVASLPKVKIGLNPNPSKSDFSVDNLPVDSVSWHESVEFCDRLSAHTGRSYRLPTEAEWEYACRAGATTKYSFGDNADDLSLNCDNSGTTPVASFPPNKFGLYDMHGNVWEWCQDHWYRNYEGAPTDGSAWLSQDNSSRLLRGGSWFSDSGRCRSAFRTWAGPDYQGKNLGFRVAMDKPQKSRLKKAIHFIQAVLEFIFTPRCTVCGWRYPKHQLREDGTCGMCESHKGVRDSFGKF